MIVSSASPDERTVFTKSLCSAVRGVSMSKLVMPMTPFMGVRISCDMEARKSLLACDAASASVFARRRWCSVSTRAVTSCTVPMMRVGFPCVSTSTDFDRTYTQRHSPGRERTRYSRSMTAAFPLNCDSTQSW